MTQPHQTDREAVALSERKTAIFSVESGVGYNNLGDVIRAGLRALGYEGHLQSRTEQIVSRIEALSRAPAPEAVAWRWKRKSEGRGRWTFQVVEPSPSTYRIDDYEVQALAVIPVQGGEG